MTLSAWGVLFCQACWLDGRRWYTKRTLFSNLFLKPAREMKNLTVIDNPQVSLSCGHHVLIGVFQSAFVWFSCMILRHHFFSLKTKEATGESRENCQMSSLNAITISVFLLSAYCPFQAQIKTILKKGVHPSFFQSVRNHFFFRALPLLFPSFFTASRHRFVRTS